LKLQRIPRCARARTRCDSSSSTRCASFSTARSSPAPRSGSRSSGPCRRWRKTRSWRASCARTFWPGATPWPSSPPRASTWPPACRSPTARAWSTRGWETSSAPSRQVPRPPAREEPRQAVPNGGVVGPGRDQAPAQESKLPALGPWLLPDHGHRLAGIRSRAEGDKRTDRHRTPKAPGSGLRPRIAEGRGPRPPGGLQAAISGTNFKGNSRHNSGEGDSGDPFWFSARHE
jgi:hypothetical protein